MKIALALIVKGTDEEAQLLDRCLENVSPFVDGIFVTSTYKGSKPNSEVDRVATKYGATISYFKWINDFASARNFNFSQVTKDYDFILWCDSDDVFRGLEKLREVLESDKNLDALAFNYLYAFDKFNNPIVVHKKTQLIRNDGCASWVGKIHEDLLDNRHLTIKFIPDIERMHLTTDSRVVESQVRNIEIAEEEAKENKHDPKSYFNLGNAHFQVNNFKKAKAAYVKFLEATQSDDEKYLVLQRLSAVEKALGNKQESIDCLLLSIGIRPLAPESYHLLGYLYFEYGMLDKAEEYLLIGLPMKPQYNKMIVYNPRDYDYNPMMALAKVYFNKSRPDLALPLLEGCLKIYPKDEHIKGLVTEMRAENDRLTKVVDTIKHIQTLGNDKEKILYAINKLPADLQSHPAICNIRNQYVIKESSTGKDIAYYCGQTMHEWNPEMAKTSGVGGSEEAVINLSKQWVKLGYNVTVYNSCGLEPMVCDGVTYKPFWHYNPRDKYDHFILWRSPRLVDSELNVSHMYVDLHDVISEGEFTEKRLKKIDKIFVKTKSHRALFPNIPDDKFVIIPNGQDFELFDSKEVCVNCNGDGWYHEKIDGDKPTRVDCLMCDKLGYYEIEKDPYLLVNTSSPERSMDVLPALFKRVKEQVPEARLKWAYGFEIFDNAHKDNQVMMDWRNKVIKEMEEAGIENMGRLSQKECAKLYIEGRILAYPSEFYEIDCITVKKAQACGCIPVTTDFAAFDESVQYGVKIRSRKTKDNWSLPYQFSFGLTDKKAQDEWVDAVVKILKSPMTEQKEMKEWTKKFSWDLIAKEWIKNI